MADKIETYIPTSGNDAHRLRKLEEHQERVAADAEFIHGYAQRLDQSFSSITKEWATWAFLQLIGLFYAEKWHNERKDPTPTLLRCTM